MVSSIPIPRLRRRLKQHLPEDQLASVQLELDCGRGRPNGNDGEAAAVNESRDPEFQDFSFIAIFLLTHLRKISIFVRKCLVTSFW